jgi:hypothetical protein
VYVTLKAARAALAHVPPPAKAAVPDRAYELTDDIEGFEMQVDRFRRYTVAAIRDRSTHGDEVAVERGRKWFLNICEQGIEAAGRVGNHAYAAMLQRQREKFCRALSDQEPTAEESGLLPLPPIVSDAAVRTMPAHELFVGFFLSVPPMACRFTKPLNIKGFLYTNSIEPIDAEETNIVSGTISGTVELAADEDDEDAIDKAFDLAGPLVEPFGGECTECRLVDRQAPARTGHTGPGLTPPPF